MTSFRRKVDHGENTARQLESYEKGARISSSIAALRDTKKDQDTHWIPLGRITTKKQIREEFDPTALEELANSIKELGQQQPCTVYWCDEEQAFVLVAGERRFRAAAMAGKPDLKCSVLPQKPTAAEHHELQLIENVQREDLNPVEEAKAYQKFIDDFGYTQSQIAKKTGISQGAISRALKLMQLPDEIRDELVQQNAPRRLAEALARLDTIEEQREMLEQSHAGILTVEEARQKTSKRGPRPTTNKQTRVKKARGIDFKATGKKKHTNTEYALGTLEWCEDLATDKRASVEHEQVVAQCCNLLRSVCRFGDVKVGAVLLEEVRNLEAELSQLERIPSRKVA
jgi:ParB/RepB/Spo0J family partition protein